MAKAMEHRPLEDFLRDLDLGRAARTELPRMPSTPSTEYWIGQLTGGIEALMVELHRRDLQAAAVRTWALDMEWAG